MKQEKWIKKGIQVIGVVLVVAVFVGGYSYMKSRPQKYHVTEIKMGDMERILAVSGDVKTEESRTYYSPVDASVQMLEIKKGDEVCEGQLLVEYDLEELTREQREAVLKVQQADSNYQSVIKQNEKNMLLDAHDELHHPPYWMQQ